MEKGFVDNFSQLLLSKDFPKQLLTFFYFGRYSEKE